MDRKEEILRKEIGILPMVDQLDRLPHYYSAMSEYAKEQSIAFAEWLDENNFMKHKGKYYDRKHDGLRWEDFPQYTFDQLYAQFIEQQQSK